MITTPVGAPTIMLARVTPNMYQPRTTFAPEPMVELALSIRSGGLVQPIVVQAGDTYHGEGKFDYTIVAGERRWRACCAMAVAQHRHPGNDDTLANFVQHVCANPFTFLDTHRELLAITPIAATLTDRAAGSALLIRATIENLHRADLSPIELAKAYQKLSDDGLSDTDIARAVGLGDKARSTVANTRRLNALPQDMKDAVANGVISTSVALAYLPAMDIKPHLMADAGLNNQPNFPFGSTPTPTALRKRLCSPELYGDKLNRDDVRRLVEKMADRCTPLLCSQCGKNVKYTAHTTDTAGNVWCKSCNDNRLRQTMVTRYCKACGAAQEIAEYFIVNPTPIACTVCGQHGYTASLNGIRFWLDEPKKEPEYRPLFETCPQCGHQAIHPVGAWQCDHCGRPCSKLEAQYNALGNNVVCKKCHAAECQAPTVTRYCPECGTPRDFEESRIKNGLNSRCQNCHASYPANEWLNEQPAPAPTPEPEPQYAVYSCHNCGEKKIVINDQAGYVHCDHCEEFWDTISDYHADRTATPEQRYGVEPAPAPAPNGNGHNQTITGECPACGHRQDVPADDIANKCPKCGSRNPTELWAREAAEPAPEPAPQRLHPLSQKMVVLSRFTKLLDRLQTYQLSELDAWLDDIESELTATESGL